MSLSDSQHQAAGGPPSAPPVPPAPLDAEAFAARFRESGRVLWLIALGVLGDRHLAEDAVQEAAVIGLRKLKTFEPGTHFTAWMGQIVRHVSLNLRRKQNRRRAVSLDGAGGAEIAREEKGPVDGPGVVGDKGAVLTNQHQFDDALMSALKSIGEVARACLLLRTIEGMDYREISELLGIPQGTAMSHVYRARRALRKLLTDNYRPGVAAGEVAS